jgi:pre-mRNA-splicing factor CDC5/CEF1
MSSAKDRLDSLDQRLNNNRSLMAKEAKKAAKLEKKLKILTDGYRSRANGYTKQLGETHEQVGQLQVELMTFDQLRNQELQAIPKRLETLREEVQTQLGRENQLQIMYSNLVLERDEVKSKVACDSNGQ